MQAEPVRAEIPEDRTVVVYNSEDGPVDPVTGLTESHVIALHYKSKRPGVILCDLDVEYGGDFGWWPACGISATSMTPCKFIELFVDGPSPFVDCLAANPDVMCIVTTRGIPTVVGMVAVQQPIYAQPNFPQNPNGVLVGSLESMLMRLRVGDWHAHLDTAFATQENPILPVENWVAPELDEWLLANCPEGFPSEECVWPIAVSRLDCAPIMSEIPLDTGTEEKSALEGVIDLIDRSISPRVNQYAVTVLTDASDVYCAALDNPNQYDGTVTSSWLSDWCVIANRDKEFLAGPKSQQAWALDYWPEEEAQYTDEDRLANLFPPIVVLTTGRNGYPKAPDENPPCNLPVMPEQPPWKYPFFYNPAPGAIFLSQESYNGFTLHKIAPGNSGMYPKLQGQVRDWIAAGGSFGVANIQEPGGSQENHRVIVKSMLAARRQWGESVLASLANLGQNQVPLGDPLARLTTYNPDLTGDHKINAADLSIVNAQMGQAGPGLQGDINMDGVVSAADRALILQAWGRNCEEPPVLRPSIVSCGDLDLSTMVDSTDLTLFNSYVQINGGYGWCALTETNWDQVCLGDVTGDTKIDEDDLAKIAGNVGVCFDYDFCDDNQVQFWDALHLNSYIGEHGENFGTPSSAYYVIAGSNPFYEQVYDYNCDGQLDEIDVQYLFALRTYYGTCIPWTCDVLINSCDIVVECEE